MKMFIVIALVIVIHNLSRQVINLNMKTIIFRINISEHVQFNCSIIRQLNYNFNSNIQFPENKVRLYGDTIDVRKCKQITIKKVDVFHATKCKDFKGKKLERPCLQTNSQCTVHAFVHISFPFMFKSLTYSLLFLWFCLFVVFDFCKNKTQKKKNCSQMLRSLNRSSKKGKTLLTNKP